MALSGLLTTSLTLSPASRKNRRVWSKPAIPAPPAPAPTDVFSILAGSSPGLVAANGDISVGGRILDFMAEGEGGRFWMACSTLVSNSAWVMEEREVESMVSMKAMAPEREER